MNLSPDSTEIFLSVLAAVFSGVAAGRMYSLWKRLTKNALRGPMVVMKKGTNKSAVLPENYSPSAVRALSELAA